MWTSRFRLSGLIAVLLALMAQLGAAASVPWPDPAAGVVTLCHTDDDGGGNAPARSTDCLVCPLCVLVHAQPAAVLSPATTQVPPSLLMVRRTELPPPSTARPAPPRPPSQPRAPPVLS